MYFIRNIMCIPQAKVMDGGAYLCNGLRAADLRLSIEGLPLIMARLLCRFIPYGTVRSRIQRSLIV